jgi:conjugative relaxase-like TrwC/TraI family protein
MNKTRLEDVINKKTGLPVIDPKTGELQKREVSNRQAGYDFTFSAPKSVSLYLVLNEDKIVEQLITEAVDETMAAIESRMETKVRKGYQQDNRLSPNLVYARFIHRETRPVDGIPDPHYHVHVFAMNATFEEVEKEWKALEVGNTVGDRTFYQAYFQHLLAAKVEAAGYGIRRTEHHFELASVNRELIEKFSRRTKLIEQRARDKYTVLEAQARTLTRGLSHPGDGRAIRNGISASSWNRTGSGPARWRNPITSCYDSPYFSGNFTRRSLEFSENFLNFLELLERASVHWWWRGRGVTPWWVGWKCPPTRRNPPREFSPFRLLQSSSRALSLFRICRTPRAAGKYASEQPT